MILDLLNYIVKMASKTRPQGYWKSLDNCIEKAKKVMEEHSFDRLPSEGKLRELGYSSLSTAIDKYHGGMGKFRKLLGQEELKKPNRYWNSLENTICEVKNIMGEHGFDRLPSEGKLRELGYSSLGGAISKYHGGMGKFRKLLGQEELEKPKKYWHSLGNCLDEAKSLMEKHSFDKFPSQVKLNEIGYGSLCVAISKYHGGLNKFRELLGEELLIKPMGYWESLGNCLDEAKSLMEKHSFDKFPSSGKLNELGYGSLCVAISKYYGGMGKFRKLLGQEELKKPNGYWNSLENTISEAKKIMEENSFDQLPSQQRLGELGYSSLGAAISNYHGGFVYFREILNEELGIKSEKEHLTELLEDYVGS